MKKFVRIQSEMNIEVTEGLQSIDMTNRDAHVADRLRVASAWVQSRVMIRKGSGVYPACIQNWDSVKALAAIGKLTVGAETDEGDAEAEEILKRVENAHRDYQMRSEAARTDSIVGTKQKSRAKGATTEVGDIIEQ